MIHLLTFESIKNVLYFFLILGGGIEIFFYALTPYTKKNCLGVGIKKMMKLK